MKKAFTLILCLIYTFVTFGGSIFVHNCGENTLLSIYEESTHDDCPICTKEQAKDTCHHGSCNDIEIKIDQLSNKLFSSHQADIFILQPAILQRHWIELKPFISIINPQISPIEDGRLCYTNSSPPTYILNRNIRN